MSRYSQGLIHAILTHCLHYLLLLAAFVKSTTLDKKHQLFEWFARISNKKIKKTLANFNVPLSAILNTWVHGATGEYKGSNDSTSETNDYSCTGSRENIH